MLITERSNNTHAYLFTLLSLCHGSSGRLESVCSKRQKYGNVHHIQTCLPSLKYLTCPGLHAETITHSDSGATRHWKGYLKIFHVDESGMFIPFLYHVCVRPRQNILYLKWMLTCWNILALRTRPCTAMVNRSAELRQVSRWASVPLDVSGHGCPWIAGQMTPKNNNGKVRQLAVFHHGRMPGYCLCHPCGHATLCAKVIKYHEDY